jgi:hypothetical protein
MSNEDRLDEARHKKESAPIEEEVAKVEADVTKKVAAEASESVEVDGWGTFYRRGDGWHGPGGYYGPGTEGAKMCEEALAKQKGETK